MRKATLAGGPHASLPRVSRMVPGIGAALTTLVLLVVGSALSPRSATGQFAEPCAVTCGLTLGAVSFVFATGASTAVGRAKGGYTTTRQGITTWSVGFLASAGAGMALSGNGARQERAVYGAALGAVGGSVAGLLVESLGESTGATRLAAALIGAAVGVVAGGVVGAATLDASGDDGIDPALVSVPAFSWSLRF